MVRTVILAVALGLGACSAFRAGELVCVRQDQVLEVAVPPGSGQAATVPALGVHQRICIGPETAGGGR